MQHTIYLTMQLLKILVSQHLSLLFSMAQSKMLIDYLFKGQNLLNDLLHVFLRFRQYKYVASGDLRKKLHSILTSEKKWDLHTLDYREMGTNEMIKTIAVTALSETLDKFKDIDPIVATQLVEHSYVDDCIVGASGMDILPNCVC